MIYVLRIISLPFVVAILAIWMIWNLLRSSFQWMIIGGDLTIFGKDDINRKTLSDVFIVAKKLTDELEEERKLRNKLIKQYEAEGETL